MANFVKICKTTEVKAGCGKSVEINGKAVGVFNVDGKFYVGFRTGGLEVGLDPNGTGGPICYWDVDDIAASVQSLVAAGATLDEAPHDVGRGLLVAKVRDADGNAIGFRQQP